MKLKAGWVKGWMVLQVKSTKGWMLKATNQSQRCATFSLALLVSSKCTAVNTRGNKDNHSHCTRIFGVEGEKNP